MGQPHRLLDILRAAHETIQTMSCLFHVGGCGPANMKRLGKASACLPVGYCDITSRLLFKKIRHGRDKQVESKMIRVATITLATAGEEVALS